MKKQFLLPLVILGFVTLALSSCFKKDKCQTCTTSNDATVRVEICDDKAITYSNDMVILEGELGGMSVAAYAATLELYGIYECH